LKKVDLPRYYSFIGVDPGKSGAIAVYSPDSNGIEVWDYPPSTKILISIFETIKMQRTYNFNSIGISCIEKLAPRKSNGVKNVEAQGIGYGKLLYGLETLPVEYLEVNPCTWKKALGVTADKKTSMAAAERLFSNPEVFYGPKGGPKDGRAEAALLAYYGYKIWMMKNEGDFVKKIGGFF